MVALSSKTGKQRKFSGYPLGETRVNNGDYLAERKPPAKRGGIIISRTLDVITPKGETVPREEVTRRIRGLLSRFYNERPEIKPPEVSERFEEQDFRFSKTIYIATFSDGKEFWFEVFKVPLRSKYASYLAVISQIAGPRNLAPFVQITKGSFYF